MHSFLVPKGEDIFFTNPFKLELSLFSPRPQLVSSMATKTILAGDGNVKADRGELRSTTVGSLHACHMHHRHIILTKS